MAVSSKALRVLFDWRVMFGQVGGNLRAMSRVLPLLAERHPALGIELLCRRRPWPEPPAGSSVAELPWPFSRFPESSIKAWAWGKWADRQTDTIFHTPYYSTLPVHDTPIVASVLDCIPEIFEDRRPHLRDLLERKRALVIRATRLLVNSECTKRDVCRVYGIAPSRVDVALLGVDAAFFGKPPAAATGEALRGKLAFSGPFLLVVGGRADHKNFLRFAEGFAASPLARELRVVAAGPEWTPEEAKFLAKLGIANRVSHVPQPDDETLRALYHDCAAFVYPSLYEGFGLPPLEAMAAGAPVAVSEGGSVPEVVGDAGYYFDPENPAAILRACETALNGGRAAERVRLGLARAAGFGWEHCADAIAACYLRTAAQSFARAA